MKKLILALSLALLAASAFAADTPQHEKMKGCNADAKAKELKGEARKAFMKECLSAKKEIKEEKK
jgi:opacity protein-like surface antigen